MAFNIRNFSILAYAQGFTHWHYKGLDDEMHVVLEKGFFASAGKSGMLKTGDLITISAHDGGAQRYVACADPSSIILTTLS